MFNRLAWKAGMLAAFAVAVLAAGTATADIVRYEAPEAPKVAAYKETPWLARKVADGELPPVAERLPAVPRVSISGPNLSVGKPGGDIRMLIGRDKDVRLLIVYGYARLVGYTMHNGCNARTFVAFNVGAPANGQTIRAGTPVVSRVPGLAAGIDADAYQTALRSGFPSSSTIHAPPIWAAMPTPAT